MKPAWFARRSHEDWMKLGYITWTLGTAAQMAHGGNPVGAMLHAVTMLGLGAFMYGFISFFFRAVNQPRIRKTEVQTDGR